MTTQQLTTVHDEARRDAFAERLFGAAIDALDLVTVRLGERLGLYRALADHGAMTAGELAAAARVDERYAREWLEQQAVTGILDVRDPAADQEARSYLLPAGHAEVLLDPTSLAHAGPLARAVTAIHDVLPGILRAFRIGGGVPYADYGPEFLDAQASLNRPLFDHLLTTAWLPSLADIDARLRAPGAAVADVACGAGWSSLAIARGYPLARVDGFDSDPASIELARRHAAEAGLEDRVRFHLRDAAEPVPGRYDLVAVFEAVHDLARPVDVLRTLRELAGADGAVLVMDERTADELSVGDDLERFQYAFSVLHCLPVGRADDPSAATGTVMRPATLRAYAAQAGFADVEVLDIEHDTFRLYRLR